MPYGGNLHINKALTNISVMYKNAEFIGEELLQNVPVKKESDIYYVWNRDFRIEDTLRQIKSPANMVTWGVSTASYVMNEYALADVVTDREIDNADSPFRLKADTTEFLTEKILLDKEKRIADLMFTTGTWGNNASLDTASAWIYNTTTSAPIQNMLSATGLILRESGKMPNTGILGWEVFEALKENPNIYNRIQYVERAFLTKDILAAAFDLEKIFVGKAYYDPNREGIAESMTALWGDYAWIGYINPSMGLRQVSAAINITKTKGNVVKSWRDNDIDGEKIQVSQMSVPKAVATSCAFIFSSVTTI